MKMLPAIIAVLIILTACSESHNESAETNGNPTNTGNNTEKQDDNTGKQDADSGKQGADSGKQDDDSGKQDADSGKQDADSGKQDADSGKQNDDSGKQNDDSGKPIDEGQFVSVPMHRTPDGVHPGTGIVFWPDRAKSLHKTYGDAISLEFSYCLPSDVVTGKTDGKLQYNWDSFDALLDDIASRGHQAVIRFRYEYPAGHDGSSDGKTAVPAYIKALSDYHETYAADPDGDGPTHYADWSNDELKWFTTQFYSDFAARYRSDPRIAFMEIGFGHWSEYHIYGTKLKPGINFPDKDYQKQFLKHIDATLGIPWLISIDAADDKYSPITESGDLQKLAFGLFDDSFMHEEHEIGSGDGYNEECWIAMGSDRWQSAPAGGEISYYEDDDQKNFLSTAGMYGTTWEEAAAKYHITFMIANDATEGNHATPERVRAASRATGYAFEVTACATDGGTTKVTVCNRGIAPLYRDAYFSIGNIRAATTLRGLLPGQCAEHTIAAALQEEAELHIESDVILPSQHIDFSADIP